MFAIRNSKPSGNKFYITKSAGGYSQCIEGNPKDKNANVLANCVGYACGRFNEIIGSMKYPYLNCNAEAFIDRAKAKYPDLKIGTTAKAGAIMVWANGSTSSGKDGAGHVAVVERVNEDGSVYTSESNYGGAAFVNVTRKNTNGRWGLSSSYKFLGFIYNPAVTTDVTNTATTLKYKVGDKVVINGSLYKSSTAAKATGSVSNKSTTITRVASGAPHPYNTTGDLGWMDEKDIKKASSSSSLAVGDKVKILSAGKAQANGGGSAAYGIGLTRYITKIHSGSAYPYQVGNKGKTDGANTTGFYKASALKKL